MNKGETFYVTTPIYYVNDRPHIGHAYTTILADVLARYARLLETPTFFLTGTDEHGQKVYEAARKNGITPQQQCDDTVVRFQELWKTLEITHDDFIRTTEPRHEQVVQQILQDLYDRGEIYADDYEGWYCVPCERFFTEKDLIEGNCRECGRPVQKLVERNYFFRMSAYQDWLVDYVEQHPDFIQPAHRRQETLGFLRQPLCDLCISRPKSRLSWGIELPFDAGYVTYVWFDALVNYISAIGYLSDDVRFNHWWPPAYHLIGKDILTTHTVYWPTMLKAMGLEMPKTIFAHGWWLVGKDKMSKSLGNVVNPMETAEIYGVDPFRYFLLAEMTLGQDASFTEEGFVTRYNADLANDLGNLASRVVKMILRNLNGTLPAPPELTDAETELVEKTLAAVKHMENYLNDMQLDRGLAEVMAAVRECNRYFEQMAPWQLAKDGSTDDLERVLYCAAECLRIVSGLLFPVMPGKMTTLRRSLGLPEKDLKPRIEELAQWGGLESGMRMADPGSLFPRVEPRDQATATTQKKQAEARKPTPAKQDESNLVDIKDVGRLSLKTARIVSAEPVEGADKLLKLVVDLGVEQRQIVAGIAKHYNPDELPGKTIVVIANLKPAVIRGVESNGMLLAAQSKGEMRLVTVEDKVPGGWQVS
ncbi:MAG: methionine--tRNA ligase [Candidatus Pacebacteria bacterium]|nr:methionine--tRNA ligase [Candidatus Paceibacterota bacterium]